ncbi:MAG: hypothetical protein FI707_10245 [SAR202 cluster bacterium]|jgi:hypothetical protein|nr:hypothetical protein [Chloroflexota bacterium]MDP6421424.1 MaoC family dehydratase N-terminal domain-containing protein [SAR202 cluster bacterium]HAL46909.1 hypothetical protein [Dehalococcoidia bacterium]MDP6664800.1 MaoC family dehydratase N-terminal domain-containing protein [SAR202 cluster bacterium]MDP6799286.1 MaoC family dehydratase N-terminal domain-containing protein [SAR202 cluster bacterium]|tara:strand:+ start:4641 stop:5141 length:501 start_codon:yes stop_codon:yes gene_type:complete
MGNGEEIRWEYEAVEIGQTGPRFTLEITDELIVRYAQIVRNPNPAYAEDTAEDRDRQLKLAMPTMIFRIAPLRRWDIAAANGFTALERVSENSRQTPFAKCEVRWFAPIRVNDVITSYGHIVDKQVRRGNKFVTFRIEASNQNDEKVAEYDYTCIFEYAKGQHKRE